MAEPFKLVLSGGSSNQKAEVMRKIRAAAAAKGYTVLLVPSAEKLLEQGGLTPKVYARKRDNQSNLLHLQLELERSFLRAAQDMTADKALLLCECGALDFGADLPEQEYLQLLQTMGLHRLELRDQYDAVFLLDSSDTPHIAAWTGHPHLRMLGGNFGIDMQLLSAELAVLLGGPKPVEIERKFLVEYPDPVWLEHLSPSRSVSITQVYLNAQPKEERRIRQRSADGASLYYKTIKQTLDGMKRTEIEHRISEKEYHALLNEADSSRCPIQKNRTYFFFQRQYFELDIYPFWTDRAILELELSSEHESVHLPEGLRLIREVTGDPHYKNAALAKGGFSDCR